jgi:hypothetical protein
MLFNRKKAHRISVGEPWDFDGPDGPNIINGLILKVVSATCIVFKCDSPLQFGTYTGEILVLSSRYEDYDFAKLDRLVPVNGALLLIEYNDALSEAELEQNSKFVIIGSIEKY